MPARFVSSGPPRGWLLLDGDCALCRHLEEHYRAFLRRWGFGLAHLQSPWVRTRLNLPEKELLREMRVLTPNGRLYGGADAMLHIALCIPWIWPLGVLGCLPGMKMLVRSVYRYVAARRHCRDGTCSLPRRPLAWVGWVPLIACTALALSARPMLPPWAFMWMIALAMFGGLKWLTWWRVRRHANRASTWRHAGYLLAWPGLDARRFLTGRPSGRPGLGTWAVASSKAMLGAGLVWGAARYAAMWHEHAGGWVGMIGLVVLLHCGLFHLVALAWQGVGVDARPIMRAPLAATSLADFWSTRWNRAFRDAAMTIVFWPLVRRLGPAGAAAAVFLVSGLCHELVISVPARGGYGTPTLYFALQAVAIGLARTRIGTRLGLNQGVRGWLLTTGVTALPAYWLFSPRFVAVVALPFLRAIGAL